MYISESAAIDQPGWSSVMSRPCRSEGRQLDAALPRPAHQDKSSPVRWMEDDSHSNQRQPEGRVNVREVAHPRSRPAQRPPTVQPTDKHRAPDGAALLRVAVVFASNVYHFRPFLISSRMAGV